MSELFSEIMVNVQDDQLKSITASGVVERYYCYDANPDGTRFTLVNTGTSTSPA